MSRVGHSAVALTNSVGAVLAPERPNPGNIQRILIDTARAISPRKTWGYLASLIHVHERVAKHRLAGTREFTTAELAVMLRSERGIDYLVAVMGEAEPAWWRKIKSHIAVAEAARVQGVARRKLKEAIHADADLAAAIARAAVFPDEDFHRPHVDALSAMARLSDRAMAPATKRRGRAED